MSTHALYISLAQRRASTQESRASTTTMNPIFSCYRRRRASLNDDGAAKTYCTPSACVVPMNPPKLKQCQYHQEPRVSCAATTTDEDEEQSVHRVSTTMQALLSPTAAAKRSLAAAANAAAAAARRATSAAMVARRRMGTVLREQTDNNELFIFREEAEYSDYLDALVTGVHTEMDSVVFYELNVHLSQTQWTVLRRFSEFRQLRQRLLKHFSKRARFQTNHTKCPICANIQQTIEQLPFPSRSTPRKHWPFNSLCSFDSLLVDRKRKLQDFIVACLLTIRGLRQHSRLMCDSSACEVSIALRMIEVFLGLSFTRYMRFLNERGIVHETHHKIKSVKTGETPIQAPLLANEVRKVMMNMPPALQQRTKTERVKHHAVMVHHYMVQSHPHPHDHINKRRASVAV